MARTREWRPIPSWDGYEAHPSGRIRRGTYVLRQQVRAGVAWVKLYKQLRFHNVAEAHSAMYRQLFVVSVDRLLAWTFFASELPCEICGTKHDDLYHHEAVQRLRRLKVPLIHIRNNRTKIFH